MYKLVIKGNNILEEIEPAIYRWLGVDVSIRDIRHLPGWDESFALVEMPTQKEHLQRGYEENLNRWLTNHIEPPFYPGELLWWGRGKYEEDRYVRELAQHPREMYPKEVSLGPVLNPDGTPSDVTRSMLAGTGRSLYPPFDPAPDQHLETEYEERLEVEW